MPDAVISTVTGGPDLETVRVMFAEYGADVSRAYCLRNFDAELAGLPGTYGPPRGALLLLRADGGAAGAVGVRALSEDRAEIKRLYVRPAWQGQGFGRRLAAAAVGHARSAGFRALCLDTLAHMKGAQALYRAMGFAEIAPYHDDTAPGMRFMELTL
ncbi:MAG TPA: GNAT family N-acetyltransferase [Rhodospirillaceae bacterium]|nr:GNAT family N-acetyltransferase [Rhodospirillaceae bacterium]|tara:strand:- start:46 stop:516 length:471 start_codon:yes stop_codon:yes gene_type:complete